MSSRSQPPYSEDELTLLIQMARRLSGRWCASPADAEDVAQEAVVRLLAQSRPPDNPATWLFVVTRRVAHRSVLRERMRTNAENAFSETHLQPGPRLDLFLDVGAILSRLRHHDAKLLTDVAEGRSSLEISVAFDCAIGNVGQMVARARGKARRLRDERKQNR